MLHGVWQSDGGKEHPFSFLKEVNYILGFYMFHALKKCKWTMNWAAVYSCAALC